MVNSQNIPLYAHKAAINNYLYCIKHGYSFMVERCPDIKDLNKDYMWNASNEYLLVWSKSVLVKRHLQNCNYLLIIDSDAIFIDFDKSIQYLIDKYFINKDVCIVAGTDCYSKYYCWSNINLNAGIMMFKNTPKTFEILNKWYDGPNNVCKDWKYRHPREQECINIIKKNYKNNILIIPHYEVNGIDGIYIKHYMLNSSFDRNNNIDHYLQINYKKLINGNLSSVNNNNNNNKIIIILFILSIFFFYYYYYKK